MYIPAEVLAAIVTLLLAGPGGFIAGALVTRKNLKTVEQIVAEAKQVIAKAQDALK